jgi:hypothetical protein
MLKKAGDLGKMVYYRINRASQIKHLEYTIGAVLMFLAYLWYLKYSGDSLSTFIIVSFIAVFLPVIIIHIEYLVINFGMKLNYGGRNEEITISRMGIERTINVKDIDKIIYNRSRSYLYKSWRFFPTDEYHYCKIVLTSGERFIITSILAPGFKVNGVKNFEIKQRFIAFVFSEGFPSPTVSYDQIKDL